MGLGSMVFYEHHGSDSTSGVSLKAPRKPGKFNRWVMRMSVLKVVASKRRLTRMLSDIFSPGFFYRGSGVGFWVLEVYVLCISKGRIVTLPDRV